MKMYRCPECNEEGPSIDDYSEEEEFFFVRRECTNCGHTWFEVYEYLRSEDEMGNVYELDEV
jgi:transcriptional regulator NrdR family protein